MLALDNQLSVPGKREFGVFLGGRIYLFADEASLQRFQQNPKRYAAEALQAMRLKVVCRTCLREVSPSRLRGARARRVDITRQSGLPTRA